MNVATPRIAGERTVKRNRWQTADSLPESIVCNASDHGSGTLENEVCSSAVYEARTSRVRWS